MALEETLEMAGALVFLGSLLRLGEDGMADSIDRLAPWQSVSGHLPR